MRRGMLAACAFAFAGAPCDGLVSTRRLSTHGGQSARGAAPRLEMAVDNHVAEWFQEHRGAATKAKASFGGSGWASTSKWVVDGTQDSYFVKTSSQPKAAMFAGEAVGLQALHSACRGTSMRIPEMQHVSDCAEGSFIIMEYLAMGGRGDQRAFGKALAEMHLAPPDASVAPEAASGKFGFMVGNTCGETPQPNGWESDWVTFYTKKRLQHQLDVAGVPLLDKLGEVLLPRIGEFFENGEEIRPSMLHGDLWSGNVGTAEGSPAIFDPACYYGHHEAEFGMSWCAGFSGDFWAGYRSVIPEAAGFQKRRPLYELYHQINHYNLFGGTYRNAAAGLMERCLKSLDD
ncbi:Fructosamine/Ketosamine-3-kinase [Pelagophyceae sp. CCMP2097]|nr:Fructosamine/Ketosamine-3-kinase [Pelagophyceae sp. CCMP2097]